MSFLVTYRIVDGELFLSRFELGRHISFVLGDAEQLIGHAFQLNLRKKVAQIDSEQLNEKRGEIDDLRSDDIEAELKGYGLQIEKAQLRDITFPKNIQDLFARQLESKIRARSDLENARTAVATARAFKNAAELMQGDDSGGSFSIWRRSPRSRRRGTTHSSSVSCRELGCRSAELFSELC